MIKKITLFLSTIFIFHPFSSSLLMAQDVYSTEPLLESIRKNYDINNFNTIYASTLDAITKHPLDLSWFFYVMFAESAYKTGRTAILHSKLNTNLNMMILSRSMVEWAKGNAQIGAGLLSQIKHLSPSISYLIGKMYYSDGKVTEGAAYFSHASDMKEAPYGRFYYGLAQMANGNFSDAIGALKDVISDTQETEKNLSIKAQLQLLRAYYGNANYKDAYTLGLVLFKTSPQKVLDHLDPGMALTAMKEHTLAKSFWLEALKAPLNSSTKSLIRDRLEMNKYLVDNNYPPSWM